MHLAQDDDVVHTFTSDRSDQPFDRAILPRRGRCGRLVPDAHGAQSARDDAAIDPVAIADEGVRSLIPGKCLRYLTRNPLSRRICCDVDPDEVSAGEPDDAILRRSGPRASYCENRASNPQNRNGLTETSRFPSAPSSTLNSTPFCAVVSPTVTYNSPMQVTACVALFRDFRSIVSSNL
jgi:hypothetical protein